MTPSGIEPATFRFVAQQPNHCATAVPTLPNYYWLNLIKLSVGTKRQPIKLSKFAHASVRRPVISVVSTKFGIPQAKLRLVWFLWGMS